MRASHWLPIAFLGLALFGLAAQTDPTPMPIPTPTIETPTAVPTDPFAWVSPTPDETGAITVVVQPGESLWVIAARAGLTLPELLALNNLTEADVINPGDVLLIGHATPSAGPSADATPSAGPSADATPPAGATSGSPTATRPPPTLRPTEARLEATICLTAFDDLTRDGVHDADEPLRAGVAFTLYNTEAVIANYVTDGVSEPKCLAGLPPGEYRVTRSIAPGEVLTTGGDWAMSLTAGSELRQAFGSFMGAVTPGAASGGQPPTAVALTTNDATPVAQQQTTAATTAAPSGPRLDWRIVGVAVLFVGGLLLLGAVLILLFRPARSVANRERPLEPDHERRFRDLDDL